MHEIRAAVITVSDSRTSDNDLSGNELVRLVNDAGISVAVRRSSTDDIHSLQALLQSVADRGDIDLVITTGGTGFGPRDNTPEATRSIIEKEAPGIAEAIRSRTFDKAPLSMLSRGVSGIRGNTLIINLPGSPKAVTECFEVIRPVLIHAIALLRGERPH